MASHGDLSNGLWAAKFPDDVDMEFTLTYEGPLPAATQNNPRRKEKHHIRQKLHPQLKELWEKLLIPRMFGYLDPEVLVRNKCSYFASRSKNVSLFRFMPTVSRIERLVCEFDLTLLRREDPGCVVHGGDLDNRIKTLFDGLKVPSVDDVRGLQPNQGEDPFFCLVEDDSLITGFRISTDRYLEPPKNCAEKNHVRLTMKIRTKTTDFLPTETCADDLNGD